MLNGVKSVSGRLFARTSTSTSSGNNNQNQNGNSGVTGVTYVSTLKEARNQATSLGLNTKFLDTVVS